ncbi:MAG TPA: cytochrome-c peroxidase [Campylobacterales bacterium]|nr:cytochrome-c peroxidase [Campylobacterales bacterium]
MIKSSIIVASMVALSTLSMAETNATALIDQAKAMGLKAIPTDKTELMKLIDNPKSPITDEKVELGKKLYFDPRLSKSGLISCNTCHNLAIGGDDGVEAAIGHGWTANPHHLNSPTVFNAVFNQIQFWDGRSPHVEDQAQGPMQAKPEMAAPAELVAAKVNSIPAYVEEFQKAYGEDINVTFEKIASTIATFERTLVTPSRYDAFLMGKADALTKEEQEGFTTFMTEGCTACHTGINLGGGMQVFDANKKYTYKDVGDFSGDKNGMVKVPTLRNIEETAPYYHNGKIWSLKEAVQQMGTTQLGKTITDENANKIVTFLKALTGTKPEIVYPVLPVETDTTPQPDVK